MIFISIIIAIMIVNNGDDNNNDNNNDNNDNNNNNIGRPVQPEDFHQCAQTTNRQTTQHRYRFGQDELFLGQVTNIHTRIHTFHI